MKHKFALIALSIILVVVLGAFMPAGGGSGSPNNFPRTITVTGSGKVFLTPDIAYINIGVHTEDTNVSTALTQNTQNAQQVVATLGKLGVDPKDIQTVNFSIYPVQNYSPEGLPMDLKYTVDNTVFITVRDLTRFGQILTAVVEGGANNIYNISFDVADRSKAISEARKAAVADARLQADELAKLAGVSITRVQSLSITSNPTPVPLSAGGYGGGMAEAAAPVPVSGGQMVVVVDAYVVYEIK